MKSWQPSSRRAPPLEANPTTRRKFQKKKKRGKRKRENWKKNRKEKKFSTMSRQNENHNGNRGVAQQRVMVFGDVAFHQPPASHVRQPPPRWSEEAKEIMMKPYPRWRDLPGNAKESAAERQEIYNALADQLNAAGCANPQGEYGHIRPEQVAGFLRSVQRKRGDKLHSSYNTAN
jgi:hypothetical protein